VIGVEISETMGSKNGLLGALIGAAG